MNRKWISRHKYLTMLVILAMMFNQLPLPLAAAAETITVTVTNPAKGASNVPVNIDPNYSNTITVTFSAYLADGPNISNVSVTGPDGDIKSQQAYTNGDNKLYINIDSSKIKYNTTYLVNIPAGAVQDGNSDINQADSLTFTTVNDTTPPVLYYSYVRADKLTLDYLGSGGPDHHDIDVNSVPSPAAFAVTASGGAVGVTSVAVLVDASQHAQVVLTLNRIIQLGETVAINYNPTLTTAKIQDQAGNQAAALINLDVTNNTPDDLIPPTVLFAMIPENNPSEVKIYFDDVNAMQGYNAANPGQGFTVLVDGVPQIIGDVSFNYLELTLQLVNPVSSASEVTIAYDGTGIVQDADGNALEAFAAKNVANFGTGYVRPTLNIFPGSFQPTANTVNFELTSDTVDFTQYSTLPGSDLSFGIDRYANQTSQYPNTSFWGIRDSITPQKAVMHINQFINTESYYKVKVDSFCTLGAGPGAIQIVIPMGIATFSTSIGAPAIPVNYPALMADSSQLPTVPLSWSPLAVYGESGTPTYQLLRAQDTTGGGNFGTEEALALANNTDRAFTDDLASVSGVAEIKYIVRGTLNGQNYFSSPAYITLDNTTGVQPLLTKPVLSVTTGLPGTLDVSWTAAVGQGGEGAPVTYQLERSFSLRSSPDTFGSVQIVNGATSSPFNDNLGDVSAYALVKYRVQAYHGSVNATSTEVIFPLEQLASGGITAVFNDNDGDHVYFTGNSFAAGIPVQAFSQGPGTTLPDGTPVRVAIGVCTGPDAFDASKQVLSGTVNTGANYYYTTTMVTNGYLNLSGTINPGQVDLPGGLIGVSLYAVDGTPITPKAMPLQDELGRNALIGINIPAGEVSTFPGLETFSNLYQTEQDIRFSKTGLGSITFGPGLNIFDNQQELAQLQTGIYFSAANGSLSAAVDTSALAFLSSKGATIRFDGVKEKLGLTGVTAASITDFLTMGVADNTGTPITGDLSGYLDIAQINYDEATDQLVIPVNHFTSYTVSVDQPPQINISGVQANTLYNTSVTPIIAVYGGEITGCTLNGNPYNSVVPVNTSGNYTLNVAARNPVNGLISTAEISFSIDLVVPTATIDKTAPVLTVTGELPATIYANNASFTATVNDGTGSGVATSGITALLDNVVIAKTFVNDTLTVNLTNLTNGNHSFVVKAMDRAGNLSQVITRNFRVDSFAPVTLFTVSPAVPNGLEGWYKTLPRVTLTTEQGATIKYRFGAESWTTYTGTITVPDGTNTLSYYAEKVSLSETPKQYTFKVDSQVPADPVLGAILSPANNKKQTITGTAEANSKVRLTINGMVRETLVPVNANGSITPTDVILNEGANTITVVAIDRAGNTSRASVPVAVTVDTLGPVFAISTTQVNNDLRITAATLETLNDPPMLQLSGDVTLGPVAMTAAGGNAYSYTAVNASGNINIKVTGTDGAGNTATSVIIQQLIAQGVGGTVDTGDVVLDIPGNALTTDAAIGVSTAQESTEQAAEMADQGLELVSPVQNFSVNGESSYTFANPITLTFSYDPTRYDSTMAQNLYVSWFNQATGQWELLASTVDAVNHLVSANVNHFTSFALMADNTPPPLTVNNYSSLNNSTITNSSLTISGSTEDGATVTVGGISVTNTAGNFSKNVILNEGASSILVEAADASGNSTSVTLTITRDTTPPNLTVSTPADNNTVRDDAIVVSGTAETSSELTIANNGTVVATTLVTDAGGAFSIAVSLSNGTNTISVTAVDALGNTSAPVTRIITRDTGAALTVATPTNNYTTNSANLTVNGTAAAGYSVSVALNGADQGVVTVEGNGNFAKQLTLVAGSNAITVTAVKDSETLLIERTVTLDQTPPALNVTAPTNNAATTSNTITVTGSTETGVVVTINNVSVDVLADGSFSQGVALTSGLNTITVRAVDAAGNETTVTRTVTYTPVISRGDGGSVTTGAEPVVSTTGSARVTPEAGGSVGLGTTATVVIPADALAGNGVVEVKVEKATTTPGVPSGFKLAGDAYSFSVANEASYQFRKPVKIRLSFNGLQIGGNEKPVICYYDAVRQQWIELGGTVQGDSVEVEVNHFTVFAVFAVQQELLTPSDMAGHWAVSSVRRLFAKGIVRGYQDRTFKPDQTITRVEFAVVIAKALGLAQDTSRFNFADQAGIPNWARGYIAATVKAGIINGYTDGKFKPDNYITRAEMAVMLSRVTHGQLTKQTVTGFKDAAGIPAWAVSAVAYAAKQGFINGYQDNTFKAANLATRAEACIIVSRLLDSLKL